ncbi:MAG: ABC transporter permease [Pantoea sp.]|uniref:ABC transporter permease n=1 Tax=Pantoea sp. TaxID=69393 RepID=UPI00239629C8|nr:ABC transporter permease [Pantoea sp.]MDE1186861.1 ABC transporter permease [Pantoea sp.]
MFQIALKIAARRLLMIVPMMLAVSLVIFVLLRLLPNDPIALLLPADAKPQDIAAIRAAYGFDLPVWHQYLRWLGALAGGDMGESLAFRAPVRELIIESLPATMELVFGALVLGLIMGVGGGLWMFSLRKRPKAEHTADLGASIMQATPEFLWAIGMILVFGVGLGVLPFIGRLDGDLSVDRITGFLLLDALLTRNWAALASALEHLALPTLALAFSFAPFVVRVVRSSLLDAIEEDFVTAARQRGLSERRILVAHALPNAALPALSMVGVQSAFLFGGTLLIEVLFTYPGMGNLMMAALRNHDVPVIQGVALIYCLVALVLNAVIDILYLILDPRLRPA